MFCPSIYPRSRSPCRNSRQNSSGLILPITSTPMVGTFGCCARAASGHAAAAPPSSVMNSRRLMWTGYACCAFLLSVARLPLLERENIGNFAALVRPGIDRPQLAGLAALDRRRAVRALGEYEPRRRL